MDELPIIAWIAAFWTAVLRFGSVRFGSVRFGSVRFGGRFLVGLALGAALAHFGWAALHLPLVIEEPHVLLAPSVGYSVLFLPLGLLLAAPWRARRAARETWLAAALGALPLAIGVARIGCLAAGCCHGQPSGVPWAIGGDDGAPARHPTVLYEMAGLATLHLAIRTLPRATVPAAVLIGLGAIRLAVEPWRAAPPLGEPIVPPAALASGWIAAGLFLGRNRWPKRASRRPRAAPAKRSGPASIGCRR